MEKYLAWDIEIYKEITKDVKDWKDIRPLGITCGAGYLSDSDKPLLWYSGQHQLEQELLEIGKHNIIGGTPVKEQMNKGEVQRMVDDLKRYSEEGYQIVTWNGLQFDFDVLAEESEQKETCIELAWNHLDIMFQFFCQQGYPVGLNYVAQGMLKTQKTEGMSGAQAPVMWQGGDVDRLKVLEYVIQDAKLTLDIAKEINNRSGLIGWITKKGLGKLMYKKMGKLLTCKEALSLPEPDTSWMTHPILREQFYMWANV